MLLNDLTRVIARHVEQWDALIVAVLLARVLAVANEKHTRFGIEVAPFDAADFLLPHGRNPPNRNDLSRILVECRGDAIELILRRPSIALVAFSDQAEPLQARRARSRGSVEIVTPWTAAA